MVNLLLKLSRAVFHWPPSAGSFEEKRALVTRFGRQREIRNFIETGTFEGDMAEAQREVFQTIVTIELSDKLCEAARRRLAACRRSRFLDRNCANGSRPCIRRRNGSKAKRVPTYLFRTTAASPPRCLTDVTEAEVWECVAQFAVRHLRARVVEAA